ncbi:MAG: DegV family protein [Defluviitaleaceae bacterium]|nr:DegV family protein [Defluviitaleaceae bacterium]
MIKIFTDSDANMPREYVDRYNIGIIPFGVSYGDETYHDDFYTLTAREFYKTCIERKAWPKTSQPMPAAYEAKFRPALEAGNDVICFCITSKFSGSYNSAVMARETLLEEFPDRKIEIIDTMRCMSIHGYIVYQACLLLEEGKEFEEIVSIMDSIKNDNITFFSVDSLDYLQKGGRLGKGAALLGSILSVKPILNFSDGELKPHSKVRGKKNAMAEIVRVVLSVFADKNADDYVGIVYSAGYDEDRKLLEAEFTAKGIKIQHNWDIGPVVGAHLGPTGYGVTFVRKYEGQNIL